MAKKKRRPGAPRKFAGRGERVRVETYLSKTVWRWICKQVGAKDTEKGKSKTMRDFIERVRRESDE